MKRFTPASLVLSALLASEIISAGAQSTAFTYQGRLRDNTIPAVGVFDLRFALYDAPGAGTQVGSCVTADDVEVTNGLFSVVLDFGVDAFTGADRWLETSLRPGSETGDYTVLTPRRALTATPYALYATSAGTAGTAISVPAVNLTGTVPLARLPGEVVLNNEAGLTLSGTFSGSGAGLAGVDADLLDGQHGGFYRNAANLTGIAPKATDFTGTLAGDVTGTQGSTVVATVGGITAANVSSGASAANAAVSVNTPNTIVKRDSSGNFAGGTLTGAFVGNGSSVTNLNASQLTTGTVADGRLSANVALLTARQAFSGPNAFSGVVQLTNPANLVLGIHAGDAANLSNFPAAKLTGTAPSAIEFTGSLAGDVTGTQAGTVVATVGGITAANVSSGATAANAATSDNTPGAIVRRDATGGFAAERVSGAFVGDGSGLTNIKGSSIVGGVGDGTVSLPSGITVVSTRPNDASLVASGYRSMMTVPAPGWVNAATANAPSARSRHTAVWDGQRLIIWGGKIAAGASYAGSGALYHPDSDSWEPVSTISAPAARANHTAIWSGTEMIVWGGDGASAWLTDGGRFSPDQQLWRGVSTDSAPLGRSGHIAVWTGTRMLIWGGQNASGALNDGALYDPTANQWSALTLPDAPGARTRATAVWADDRVIIWGGEDSAGVLNSGSQLLFADDLPTQWQPLPSLNAPAARRGHSAIWTGQKMIVWGGEAAGAPMGGGAAFDPAANTWVPLAAAGAPVARFNHAAAWTGQEMLIVGGSTTATELASGSAYDFGGGAWWSLSSAGNPQARSEATASWTGTELLVFGGRAQGQYLSALQRLVPQPVWYFYRKL